MKLSGLHLKLVQLQPAGFLSNIQIGHFPYIADHWSVLEVSTECEVLEVLEVMEVIML